MHGKPYLLLASGAALAAIVVLTVFLWKPWEGSGRASERPDIILVTVDTLRADHLGCYGYHRNTTPNLDYFAMDALVFENCVAQAPLTGPSCASILTGYLPHETKVLRNRPLPAKVSTLPEILREHGYTTLAVVGNYILKAAKGWAQGFTVYDDSMKEREQNRKLLERTASGITEQAIRLLKRHGEGPIFLWVHYQDPHGPYTPPEHYGYLFSPEDAEPRLLPLNASPSGRGGIPSYQVLGAERDYHFYVSRYDGEIRYFDEEFGRLLEALKELGLYKESIILFTADHGEGMGEQEYYFAHGESLYQSQLHVPLLLKHGTNPGGRSREFVQHLDIVPTVLAAAGVAAGPGLRGRDLGGDLQAGVEILSEMGPPPSEDGRSWSLVSGGFKLILTSSDGEYQLFDLRKDPREERDLFGLPEFQEKAQQMIIDLDRIRGQDRLGIRAARRSRPPTKEELDRLRAMGYGR